MSSEYFLLISTNLLTSPQAAATSRKIFEPGREDDFDDLTRCIPRVPEGMPLLARFEHPGSLLRHYHLIPQQRPERFL
jgi:hypothetical protein